MTNGGTGFSVRDVTPEATKGILDRETPGIVIALITESLKRTPFAMISRLAAGIRGSTLIVNFPGSAKACRECFQVIQPVLTHCVDQLRGDVQSVQFEHEQMKKEAEGSPSPQVVHISVSGKVAQPPPPALRERVSHYEMIEADEAAAIILHEMTINSSTELVPIRSIKQLINRCLAVDLRSNVNIPPFPASIKDGYAVLAIDGGGSRRVLPTPATAGTQPMKIQVSSGHCVRISTGAPVPIGADAVVPVEDTQLVSATPDGEELEIFIKSKPSFGQEIRSVGSDIKRGEIVLKEGTTLGPVELGLLSSIGFSDVPVIKMPSVGILSTGDEIIAAGQSPSSGKIWDANKICLAGLLAMKNMDYIDLGIARDDPDEVYNKLEEAFDNDIDVLITTGGVSMGEKDVVKRILEVGFEAKIHFGRVNVKPGKPMAFLTCEWKGTKKAIFALPGNPVSAFVTCYLFVLPALLCLSGKKVSLDEGLKSLHRTMTAVLKLNKASMQLDSRPEFCRGLLSFDSSPPVVELIRGSQASSRLVSVRDANALVMFPQKTPSRTQMRDGEMVNVILIN